MPRCSWIATVARCRRSAWFWGLQTVVDDGLEFCDVVYLERGDHKRLLKVTRDQFRALMQPVLHGRFSDLRIH